VFVWRTPHGYWYRTDHTGTHPLGRHPTDADLAGRTRLPRDPRIVTDPGTRAPTTPASPAEAHLAAPLAVP
jgi:hypothetical protein